MSFLSLRRLYYSLSIDVLLVGVVGPFLFGNPPTIGDFDCASKGCECLQGRKKDEEKNENVFGGLRGEHHQRQALWHFFPHPFLSLSFFSKPIYHFIPLCWAVSAVCSVRLFLLSPLDRADSSCCC